MLLASSERYLLQRFLEDFQNILEDFITKLFWYILIRNINFEKLHSLLCLEDDNFC